MSTELFSTELLETNGTLGHAKSKQSSLEGSVDDLPTTVLPISSSSNFLPVSDRLSITAGHSDLVEAMEALNTWAQLYVESNGSSAMSEAFLESSALDIILGRLVENPILFVDLSVR
jgi:hypothetical protein